MALFSDAGVELLLRWLHFLAGITWIGLLYYFNFVQGPFFAEADAATKSTATQKLVPRALWWFRWSAMATFLSGLLILSLRGASGAEVWRSTWGVSTLTGAAGPVKKPLETVSSVITTGFVVAAVVYGLAQGLLT